MARSPTSAPRERIQGLDGIRALACLAVFFQHYKNYLSPAQIEGSILLRSNAWAQIGVTSFFILSGLVLSVPFWRAWKSNAERPNLFTFAQRRLARIAPAYFATLGILALCYSQGSLLSNRFRLLSSLTFTNTFVPDTFFLIEKNGALWSVPMEMQACLVFVLLVLGIWRMRSPRMLLATLLGAIGSLSLANWQLLVRQEALAAWIGNPRWFRTDSHVLTSQPLLLYGDFLLGVLGGYLHVHRKEQAERRCGANHRSWKTDLVFGLSLVVAVLLFSAWSSKTYGSRIALSQGARIACAVAILTAPHTTLVRQALESAPLRWLATYSFGIYLWHLPILCLLADLGFGPGVHLSLWGFRLPGPVPFGLVAFSLATLAGILSFHGIERPCLSLVQRLHEGRASARKGASLWRGNLFRTREPLGSHSR